MKLKLFYAIVAAIFVQWLATGQCIAQSSHIEYTYDQAGNRRNRLIIYAGIPQQTKKTTESTDTVMVQDHVGDREVKFYPNPTKGDLTMRIVGGDASETMTVAVYDGQGKLLYSSPVSQGSNTFDFRQYPTGWYILKLNTGNRSKEYKIIKQ